LAKPESLTTMAIRSTLEIPRLDSIWDEGSESSSRLRMGPGKQLQFMIESSLVATPDSLRLQGRAKMLRRRSTWTAAESL
jgi:hypothetical protein